MSSTAAQVLVQRRAVLIENEFDLINWDTERSQPRMLAQACRRPRRTSSAIETCIAPNLTGEFVVLCSIL